MRRSAPLGLLLAALGAAPAAAPERPETGCTWVRLSEPELGLELLHQRCDLDYPIIDFTTSVRKRTVYRVTRDPVRNAETLDPVIVMHMKKPKESPESAVRRVGLKGVGWGKRRRCEVRPRRLGFLGSSKSAFVIAPDEGYAAELAKRHADEEVPKPPCGEMGDLADGLAYFEFHPDEHPRRFAFVFYGHDERTYFDPASLRFLPE